MYGEILASLARPWPSDPIPVEMLPTPEPDDKITDDKIFIRRMSFERAGTVMAQHTHPYGHTTYIATGGADVWADGVFLGRFGAHTPIFIPAGVGHKFLTTEPNTTILCLHNWLNPDAAAFLREHGVEEEA